MSVPIVTLHEHSDLRQCKIAQICGVSQSSVSKILKRFKLTGSLTTNNVGRGGRKRKTSARAVRILLVKSKKYARLTSEELRRELQHHGCSVSARTIRRRLLEFKRPARRPVKRQMLTPRMKRSRLEWAKNHRHWTTEDWKKVKLDLTVLFVKFESRV